jgi:hypothetical protein
MTAAALPVSARRRLASRCTLGVVFSAAIGLTAVSSAWAQSVLPGAPLGAGNIATGQRGGVQPTRGNAPLPAPDAVPGARARQPVAPATRSVEDMEPTDALFDAINRGDVAAARDALNRGADMNGVNILGMTPMELSVDLGRNDISFLLLSMRGEDGARPSHSGGQDVAPRASRPVLAAKPVAPVAKAPPVAKQAVKPKLFANDGGTPLPSAGFLGFGSRSAAN